jgi:hypothetical protein
MADDDGQVRAHQVGGSQSVERADELQAEIVRETLALSVEAGAVHDYRATLVPAWGVAYAGNDVRERTDAGGAVRGGAGDAVSVQHDHGGVGALEERPSPPLRGVGLRGDRGELMGARRSLELTDERGTQSDGAEPEQRDELETGDRRGHQGPRAPVRVGTERMIHGPH